MADVAREEAGPDRASVGDDGGDGSTSLVVIPGEFTTEGAPMRLLSDGDEIKLLQPLQGGHIVLLGAQVPHFPTNAATLHVRARRPDSGLVVSDESRTVAMVDVEGAPDQTKQPDLRSRSQVANVALCPDYDAIDIVDQPLLFEIQVTALYTDPPQMGSARIRLVPSCRQTDPSDQPLCQCECRGGYVLGRCAPGQDAASP